MKRGNVPLFSPHLLLSVLLLLLLTSAPFKSASAKGPILTPPPISIYFSVKQGSLALNLTRSQLSALEDFTRSIPQLYNSSWKAAISDVLAKNAQILQDRWLSDIRLDVIEQLKGQQGLAVHVDATYPGSVLVVVNGSHPIDSMLNNTLAQLNGQLSVTLSVTGPYFPSAEQELYYFTDPYFHNLRKCNGAEHCSDSDLFLASL